MGVYHFRITGQVQSDLEEFQRIVLVLSQERKHFGVLYAPAGCHPLYVSLPETSGSSQGIRMVTKALVDNGDCLKAPVRMVRESWYRMPVVHTPAQGIGGEVIPQISSFQGGGWSHLIIAFGVVVQVIDTKKEGILCFPGESQGKYLLDGIGHDEKFSPKVRIAGFPQSYRYVKESPAMVLHR